MTTIYTTNQEEKTISSILKEIDELAPKIWSNKGRQPIGEYPTVSIDGSEEYAWLAYDNNRPILKVKDDYYFRRYNDDWNDTVIKGRKTIGGKVQWDTSVDRDELEKIRDILKSRFTPERCARLTTCPGLEYPGLSKYLDEYIE